MFAFPHHKTCRLVAAGAMSLALAGTAFADAQVRSSAASRDVSSRLDGRLRPNPTVAATQVPHVQARQPLEVVFQDAQGNIITGGTLRVFDHADNLIDIARPSAGGGYTLGADTRGKLKFSFDDVMAMKAIASGTRAIGTTVTGASYFVGLINPKIDNYAEMLGIAPAALYQAGEIALKPHFSLDGLSSAKPLDGPAKAGGPDSCSATPLAIGGSDLDVFSGAAPDGNACAGAVGGGLYYSFVGTGDLVTVSTCALTPGALFPDSILNIYTGPDCDNLSCVAANDDFCGFSSEVTFCAGDGVTYWAEVENWGNGSTGEAFQIDLIDAGPGPATNGGTSCEAAQPVAVGESVVGNSTCGGVNNFDSCALPFGPAITGATGLWYTFEGTGGVMTISTDNPGTVLDTQLRLYCTGCGDGGEEPVCIASDDDSGAVAAFGFSSEIAFQSEAGIQYDVFVGGFAGGTGQFELSLESEAPGSTQWVTPADIQGSNGPHSADGRTEGSCGGKGAVCIKCLTEADCLEGIDRLSSDRIHGTYMGDDSTCTSKQGAPVEFIISSPELAYNELSGLLSDTIVIPDSNPITNMAVLIDVSHTFIADNDMRLTHEETGTSSVMWLLGACGGQADLRVIWDINGGPSLLCTDTLDFNRLRGAPGVVGDVGPFIGEDKAGNWRFDWQDFFAGDSGTFHRWGLEFDDRITVRNCGPRNNGHGNGYDAQPGHSDNCNDCP